MEKIIGKKILLNPEEYLKRMDKLNNEIEILRQYPKPKGLVFKFKTWDELFIFNLTRRARNL
jgi:hypothetical protein